ncbi:hypothetical protein LOD99_9304 [Oopsacas minuta]|uniref:Uncharacterized protein n=1 Tax=Oopsacas minuta TaxID=111878 RepID=A0AAV7JBZ0_9METZ|nr:hypothetical protein LOD99_9304 [Oopsacas minuta]
MHRVYPYTRENIHIRESVLEIISLLYMLKFKKGECDVSPNSIYFQDGELYPASEIIAVSHPYTSQPLPPALHPRTLPKPSPPPSLNSTNGTTTDSCTESTGSENNFENYHTISHAHLPLSQRRILLQIPTVSLPNNRKLSDTVCESIRDKEDSSYLEFYEERPGSLSDLLERDKYATCKPQLMRQSDETNDFGSHPNISHSLSWHRMNPDNRRDSQQEVLFCTKYGSIYCESLEDSLDDDLNSVCSEYSRSTSVISTASSLVSNKDSTKLDAILRKDRSLSSLSLDARIKKRKTPNPPKSDKIGRKNIHMHTTSDIGTENFYGTENKYGSLPHVMRKRSSGYDNPSKLSAPISQIHKLDKVTTHLDKEEMSDIMQKASGMYKLEGYTDQEVCQMLAPDTVEANELGLLYSSFFDFTELGLVDAFRVYLRHLKLEGESQEQDRIVEFFSKRYHACNQQRIGSADAIHVLVCSLLLLNADLHGQNLSKSMTFRDFYDNLLGQCNGKNFPTSALKECYLSVKKKSLETGSKGLQASPIVNVGRPEETGEVTIPIENSMVSVDIATDSKSVKEGPLYIKNITDIDGKRTSGKQRQWRIYYAQIRGPLLVLWSMADTKRFLSDYRRVYPLTHSLARPCPEYAKRNHVLRVNTCQRQVMLIDARDLLDMQGWVSAVNLTAALHSSPPMAGAIEASTTFSRPTIPIGPSKLEKEKQIEFLEKTIDELENDLEKYSPDNFPLEELKNKTKNWVKDMLDYRNFLASELHRYRVYTCCIDLYDKDNLFQQKPVYYLSRLLQNEFEPIIETPEEVPTPKAFS